MAGRVGASEATYDGFLEVSEPFNLEATLGSGQAFRWRRMDSGWYGGTVGRLAVVLRQEPGGLAFRCGEWMAEGVHRVLYDYFRLEDDLQLIYREISWDSRMAQAIQRHRGLRLLRQEPWECLVSFVCSSVSNIPRISRNLEAVAQRYGEPWTVAGQTMYTFPTPERLACAEEGELRGLGMGFRARYVAKIASEVAAGAIDLDGMRRASYEEAKGILMALPGVGEKVADCVLVFSLDKLEGFPVDRWVRRGLEEWYLPGEGMSYQALRCWAQERWGRHAGYAQQYLFHDRRLAGRGGRSLPLA